MVCKNGQRTKSTDLLPFCVKLNPIGVICSKTSAKYLYSGTDDDNRLPVLFTLCRYHCSSTAVHKHEIVLNFFGLNQNLI